MSPLGQLLGRELGSPTFGVGARRRKRKRSEQGDALSDSERALPARRRKLPCIGREGPEYAEEDEEGVPLAEAV